MVRRIGVVLTAMLLVVAGSCSEPERAPAVPGTFSVALSEPARLLPAEVTDLPGRLVADAVWTPLFAARTDAPAVRPLAALSATSTDLITWTVRLRPGMRFHDGSPVTAQSYVDTWRTVLLRQWRGAEVLTKTLRAKDFRAADPLTVELVLERPLGQVPLMLCAVVLVPLPPSALSAGNWTEFAKHPVGNGPYRMVEPWRPGSGARLARVEDYQGPAKGIAREITLRVAANPDEQYELARSGQVDLATEVPGGRHHQMHSDFGDRVLMWPLPEVTMLGIPLRDKRFTDAAARHALALAVDRAALEAGPLRHQVDVATSVLPPAVVLGRRSAKCRPCNFDPTAAKALWEQANSPATELSLTFPAGADAWAQALAKQLGATLNLTVSPKVGESQDGLSVLTRTPHTRSPHELLASLTALGYANAAFDQAMTAADTADLTTSGDAYRRAENQVLRDLPVLPLWSGHGHAVWGQRLSEVTPSPSLAIDLATIKVA